MTQKNIKDTKDDIKIKKIKQENKEIKDVKDAVKAKIKETAEQQKSLNDNKKNNGIQLGPQEAYKLFQEEQKKLEQLNNNLTEIEQAVFEFNKTIFAVSELEKSKDKELFINLGNNVFIKAKLDNTDQFIFSSGSKAMLTKTSKDILDLLKKRKEKSIANTKRLNELIANTQSNINTLYKYLNTIQQKHNSEKNKQ